MPPNHDHQEHLNFAEFLSEQMHEKGISLKRLSESTGIATRHLEAMLRGDFDTMPPTPYFRGYLNRIAKTIGFNADEWWSRIKKENLVGNSGPKDSLPENRFEKRAAPKWIWLAAGAAILIIIYLSITLPRILGRPSLAIIFPNANPYLSTSTSVTIQGIVHGADALYLGNGDSSSTETVTVAPDGSWQKTVLLQMGLNTFEFRAKKFLGAETSITEQILYEISDTGTSTASSTPPAVHFENGQPATGTFYQ